MKALTFNERAVIFANHKTYRTDFPEMTKDQVINGLKKCWLDIKKWNNIVSIVWRNLLHKYIKKLVSAKDLIEVEDENVI